MATGRAPPETYECIMCVLRVSFPCASLSLQYAPRGEGSCSSIAGIPYWPRRKRPVMRPCRRRRPLVPPRWRGEAGQQQALNKSAEAHHPPGRVKREERKLSVMDASP